MRRKDREVSSLEDQLDIINACDVCRLALNDEGGFPYIVPMNFGVDVQGDEISLYFHGANEGTKLDLIARDNRASFEMDCDRNLILYEERMSCTMGYRSVIGRGVIEVVSEEQKLEALKIIMRHYHAEDFEFSTKLMPVTTVLKLTVSSMVGKQRNNLHAPLREVGVFIRC